MCKRALAQPCPGKFHGTVVTGRAWQLRKLRASIHPRTGAPLEPALPELYWDSGHAGPTARRGKTSRQKLQRQQQLHRRGCWLLVDAAAAHGSDGRDCSNYGQNRDGNGDAERRMAALLARVRARELAARSAGAA